MVVKVLLYLGGEEFADIKLKHSPSKDEHIWYKGKAYRIEGILHYPMDTHNYDLLLHLSSADV